MTRGFATALLAVFLLVTPAAAEAESHLERIRDDPLALNADFRDFERRFD